MPARYAARLMSCVFSLRRLAAPAALALVGAAGGEAAGCERGCATARHEVEHFGRLPRVAQTQVSEQRFTWQRSGRSERDDRAARVRKPLPLASDSLLCIGYMADLEGNLDYFRRSCELNPVLELTEQDGGRELHLELVCAEPGATPYFVFGGDVFDKGRADIRIARALVSLKQRYPEQVFLLFGNRDLNKAKMSSELALCTGTPECMSLVQEPYWQPDVATRVTLRRFLSTLLPCTRVRDGACSDSELVKVDTAVNRVKYMLAATMGAPHAFEFRREELAALSVPARRASDVSDEEVATNFYIEASEIGGVVRQYLHAAQIGVVIGNTVFVHGALLPDNIGFIPSDDNLDAPQAKPPGHDTRARRGNLAPLDAREWLSALNAWADQHIDAWLASPRWIGRGTSRRRCGAPLFGFAYARAMGRRTPIIQKYTIGPGAPSGQPRLPGRSVADYLANAGIHRVVVGHQPWGDCPLPMRDAADDGFEVIMTDTSFSDGERAAATQGRDTRGHAASSVWIVGTPGSNHVAVRGMLRNGRRINFRLPDLPYESAEARVAAKSTPLGLQTLDGFWVKAQIANSTTSDDCVLVARARGRRHEEQLISVAEAQRRLRSS